MFSCLFIFIMSCLLTCGGIVVKYKIVVVLDVFGSKFLVVNRRKTFHIHESGQESTRRSGDTHPKKSILIAHFPKEEGEDDASKCTAPADLKFDEAKDVRKKIRLNITQHALPKLTHPITAPVNRRC